LVHATLYSAYATPLLRYSLESLRYRS